MLTLFVLRQLELNGVPENYLIHKIASLPPESHLLTQFNTLQ